MTTKQQEQYDKAIVQYTNLTGWDYLKNLPKPKSVKKANENINQAINFLFGVYSDVQNSVKNVR